MPYNNLYKLHKIYSLKGDLYKYETYKEGEMKNSNQEYLLDENRFLKDQVKLKDRRINELEDKVSKHDLISQSESINSILRTINIIYSDSELEEVIKDIELFIEFGKNETLQKIPISYGLRNAVLMLRYKSLVLDKNK